MPATEFEIELNRASDLALGVTRLSERSSDFPLKQLAAIDMSRTDAR